MKKTFLLFATAIMFFSSCSKDEDINITNLVGTWDECYDNPYFIMDGIVEYTFYENGTYQVYSYDALSHMEHTRTGTYILQDDWLIAYSGDTRSLIPVISVHLVSILQYRWQS